MLVEFKASRPNLLLFAPTVAPKRINWISGVKIDEIIILAQIRWVLLTDNQMEVASLIIPDSD